MRIELCSSCETKRLGRKVFEAKRPANPEASRSQFADGQWQLELSNMLAGDAGSKQSGSSLAFCNCNQACQNFLPSFSSLDRTYLQCLLVLTECN